MNTFETLCSGYNKFGLDKLLVIASRFLALSVDKSSTMITIRSPVKISIEFSASNDTWLTQCLEWTLWWGGSLLNHVSLQEIIGLSWMNNLSTYICNVTSDLPSEETFSEETLSLQGKKTLALFLYGSEITTRTFKWT